jgi:hypothetical protein
MPKSRRKRIQSRRPVPPAVERTAFQIKQVIGAGFNVNCFHHCHLHKYGIQNRA